jgi:hypothetical protein
VTVNNATARLSNEVAKRLHGEYSSQDIAAVIALRQYES